MADSSVNLPYTVLGTILIGAIIMSSFVIYPRIEELRESQATVATTEAKIIERQAFLQTIDRKRIDLERNSIHERELNVVLPAEDTITDLLRIIERHATEAGVVVQQITNQSSSARAAARSAQARGDFNYLPAGVVPVSVSVAGSGNYLQWRQFMKQLEASIRLIDIPHVSLAGNLNTPENLTGQLTIQTYLIETSPPTPNQ